MSVVICLTACCPRVFDAQCSLSTDCSFCIVAFFLLYFDETFLNKSSQFYFCHFAFVGIFRVCLCVFLTTEKWIPSETLSTYFDYNWSSFLLLLNYSMQNLCIYENWASILNGGDFDMLKKERFIIRFKMKWNALWFTDHKNRDKCDWGKFQLKITTLFKSSSKYKFHHYWKW